MNDDDLCTSEYPGDGMHGGQLCDLPVGHEGNHSALAEIAGAYRRCLRWTAVGAILPDHEYSKGAS